MANTVPKEVKKEIADAWVLESWKVCLLTNAFTYGVHVFYTDLTNEVIGVGYTVGGAVVTGKTASYDSTNVLTGAVNTAWPAATFANVRYAVVYNAASPYKIRAIYDFGADKTVTNGTFTIQWNSAGLIKIL